MQKDILKKQVIYIKDKINLINNQLKDYLIIEHFNNFYFFIGLSGKNKLYLRDFSIDNLYILDLLK